MVRNRHASTLIVKDPVVGALKANFVIPVPFGTSEISYVFDGSEDAFSRD